MFMKVGVHEFTQICTIEPERNTDGSAKDNKAIERKLRASDPLEWNRI
jgi:hypothetical protein